MSARKCNDLDDSRVDLKLMQELKIVREIYSWTSQGRISEENKKNQK